MGASLQNLCLGFRACASGYPRVTHPTVTRTLLCAMFFGLPITLQDADMKGADKSSSGQGAATVYRDKKGRKLDMLNEFMKQQDARAGKEVSRVFFQA